MANSGANPSLDDFVERRISQVPVTMRADDGQVILEEEYLAGYKHEKRCNWLQTTTALLSLQLG